MVQRAAGTPSWVREMVQVHRVAPPVGHTIRAALTVGVPVAVGFAVDEAVVGVTVALACVLRTIGERQGPHRVNLTNLLIATPVAACGYSFAAAQHLPLAVLVAMMAAAAFIVGVIGRWGEPWALGGMQFLLVSSIAVGVPDTGVLDSIGLFLAGAALYGVCMAFDHLVFEREVHPASPSSAPRVFAVSRPDAATLRQAGRLALCFGLAVSARAWVDLQHWFWVPATVGLVMQPSFGSVPGRAVLRVVGTLGGALVAALVLAPNPEGAVLAVAIGLLAATIPWAKLASYALQSASLAVVVVLLVDQLAPSSSVSLPVQRVVAAAIGGAIVFVFGYALWPEARRLEDDVRAER